MIRQELHRVPGRGVAVPAVVHLQDLDRHGELPVSRVMRMGERAVLDYLAWADIPVAVLSSLRLSGCRVELGAHTLGAGETWVQLSLLDDAAEGFELGFAILSADEAVLHASGALAFEVTAGTGVTSTALVSALIGEHLDALRPAGLDRGHDNAPAMAPSAARRRRR